MADHGQGVVVDDEAPGTCRGGLAEGQHEGFVLSRVVGAREVQSGSVSELLAGGQRDYGCRAGAGIAPGAGDEGGLGRGWGVAFRWGRCGSPLDNKVHKVLQLDGATGDEGQVERCQLGRALANPSSGLPVG